MQIKDLGTEKTIADNSDLIPIQQVDGITRRITKANLLAGFSGGNKFIQLLDKKASGVNGGTATVNAWTNKIINTINFDETGLVTLLSNAFILPAGTYEIDLATTFYTLSDTKIRIHNVTDNLTLLYGINAFFNPASTNTPAIQAHLRGKFTIAASKSLALQYWTKPASAINIYNHGGSVSDGSSEIYTCINLKKVA